jgi:glutathionyl-hydroquinone reductase
VAEIPGGGRDEDRVAGFFGVAHGAVGDERLWAYARDLFQTPGFGDTIDFDHLKRHYYLVHRDINPTGIVPAGPDLAGWLRRHDREQLGGRPFGAGASPPPPPQQETVPAEHTPGAG